MKTAAANEEGVEASGTGFTWRLAATVSRMTARLRRGTAPRHAAPWHAGYDAFYDSTAANPYPGGSDANLAWEQGRKAASEDFGW
ncbi:MAG: hypothetical protein V7631_2872 [Massilia sp.]|jgi:hypothetical protein